MCEVIIYECSDAQSRCNQIIDHSLSVLHGNKTCPPSFALRVIFRIPSLQKRRYMPLFVDDQICNRTKDLLVS